MCTFSKRDKVICKPNPPKKAHSNFKHKRFYAYLFRVRSHFLHVWRCGCVWRHFAFYVVLSFAVQIKDVIRFGVTTCGRAQFFLVVLSFVTVNLSATLYVGFRISWNFSALSRNSLIAMSHESRYKNAVLLKKRVIWFESTKKIENFVQCTEEKRWNE